MRTLWIVLTALVVSMGTASVPALAQRPPAADLPQQQERMAQLQFLVGEWEGDGWMEFQPGQRTTFRSYENVESRLGGLALVIEGKHWGGPAEQEHLVHHALALVTWNESAGQFRFQTQLADGHGGDATGQVEDGKFVWSPPGGGGMKMRYIIGLDEQGRWAETGEVSMDGETWREFFGMTLEPTAAGEGGAGPE